MASMVRHSTLLLALALTTATMSPAQPGPAVVPADPASRRDEAIAELPAPSAAEQRQLTALRETLTAVAASLEPDPQQRRGLGSALRGLAARPPASPLVDALAERLQTALTDTGISPAGIARLAEDLRAVFLGKLAAEDLETVLEDAAATLVAGGVDRTDADEVAAALRALAGR